jgi:pyruvate dehydrogenase E1 component alpha subunit
MYSGQQKLNMYELLVLARKYCLGIQKACFDGKIIGMHHLGTGEEAIGTAVAFATGEDDWITPMQRWQAVWLKRVGLELHSAEQFGKVTGLGKGMCCDLHVAYPEQKIMYNNCLMGSNPAIASGFSYGLKLQNKGQVHVAGVGDGSFNEGLVYEAMELAVENKCPLVIVLHDNGWGMSYKADRYWGSLGSRADAFGMPSITVDGNDILATRAAMDYAVDKARRGTPNLVHAKTHRWYGHFVGDDQSYEDAEETKWFRENDDPVKRYEKVLKAEGLLTADSIENISKKLDEQIAAAWLENIAAAFPGRSLVLDKTKVYAKPWEGDEE